jgi:DNA-nicking Smr family endonuclease
MAQKNSKNSIKRIIEYLWSWLTLIFGTLFNIFVKSKQSKDSKRQNENLIYEQARSESNLLREELAKLKRKLNYVRNSGQKHENIMISIAKKEIEIRKANEKASEEIFKRINSPKSMKKLIFDFHGLHLDEAKLKLREIVESKVTHNNKVTIIPGWGKHCKDGESKLKKGLQEFIINELNLNCESVANNEGMLIVSKKFNTKKKS